MGTDDTVEIVEEARMRADYRRLVRKMAAAQLSLGEECSCEGCLCAKAIMEYVPDDDAPVPE